MNVSAILKIDIEKWKKTTQYLKEKFSDLTPEEQSAFDILSDYWRNNNFDKKECNDLIHVLAEEASKHGNMPELKTFSQDFRGLCKRYYTKEEETFKAFQQELGGKPKPRTTIILSAPTPLRQTQIPVVTDDYGRKNYDDGDYYIGELNQGRRHGRGKYFYADGSWAEGEWVNDGLTGHARRFLVTSERMDEGEYQDWNRVGRGRMVWNDGDWCAGEWNNSGLHGEGSWYAEKFGRKDLGTYRDGKRSGKGRMEWNNGEWYEGEWDENGIHGFGKYYNPNWGGGATYTGYFQNGNRSGKGKVVWNDGDWYDGDWLSDQMTGQGSFYHKNLQRCDTGGFRNGDRIGSGIMKWDKGDKYIGTWEDTPQGLVGTGTYYYSNGNTEKGKYVNGNWIKSTSFGDVWHMIGTILLIIGFIAWIGGALLVWFNEGFWVGLLYGVIGMFVFGIYYWVLRLFGLVND